MGLGNMKRAGNDPDRRDDLACTKQRVYGLSLDLYCQPQRPHGICGGMKIPKMNYGVDANTHDKGSKSTSQSNDINKNKGVVYASKCRHRL